MHQIRNDSLRAHTVLKSIKENCKRHAEWIQQVETGQINEEVGFMVPLKQSRIAKDRFEQKATQDYLKRFKKWFLSNDAFCDCEKFWGWVGAPEIKLQLQVLTIRRIADISFAALDSLFQLWGVRI